MPRLRPRPILVSLIVGGLIACGGGGGSSSGASGTPAPPTPPPPAPTQGFVVPTEVSAVAPKAGSGLVVKLGSETLTVGPQQGTATDPGTDYSTAKTTRFVAEHSVNQFEIIQTILNAMAQTHYADSENLNAGPYKAIVAWQESDKGTESKVLQTWVVDSAMLQEGGQNVNRVRAWIEDEGRIIKAEFKITASATTRTDGTYADYGAWSLNAGLGDPSNYFAARASVGAGGGVLLGMNSVENHDGQSFNMRAFMNRTDATGFGKVAFPDWTPQGPVMSTLAYAYNAGQLRVKDAQQDRYKDRNATVEITQRYGMFDGGTGADVLKTRSFGFPVQFTAGSQTVWGYYGAWQGRHQLWAGQNGQPPADGTVVTRMDRGTVQETYKTASFTGTLTRRSLVASDLGDLLNIPVETWVNSSFELRWSGSQWERDGAAFTDFASLVLQPRKWVGLNRWDPVLNQPKQYVYLEGQGFFEARMDPATGQLASTGVAYTPAANDRLWVNVGGSVYLEYKGAGTEWVQKKVTAFDERTWTPTFDGAGDQPFVLDLNRQYYINKRGGNYVVTRTGSGIYDVRMELQAAANPVNAGALVSGIASFRPQGYNPAQPGDTSSYRLDTDPASPTFLKLVYLTIGAQDAKASPAPTAGSVVASGLWGLVGCDAGGQSTGVQFNWDYPRQGEAWGTQTFLYTDAQGGGRTYKLLDDPIALRPLALNSRSYSLQYDGWLHGLPEYWEELQRNQWNITEDIASKIVNIPAGTQVTDAVAPGQTYLLKPLEIGVYLKQAVTPDPTLDIAPAQAIDLADPAKVPAYVDPQMGAVPANAVLKYSEGKKVN